MDKIPIAGAANGYASLWVTSPLKTYAFLKKINSTFIRISAISNMLGIDSSQGTYTVVLVSDSEGNAVLFSGYIGE